MAETHQEIEYSEVAPSRGWLIARYGARTTQFAWPPFRGTHQECYQALAGDVELVPAEGLDLALLANGAYTQDTPQWNSVRGNFRSNYVRAPNRVLLIPAGNIEGDTSLSGILVEKDTKGIGLGTKMNVPDLSGWRQNSDGVYISGNNSGAVFVPSTAYDDKPFEKDGVVQTHLTPKGAALLARTAKDAGLVPHNWLAQRVKEITSPEQRVSLLSENDAGLSLDGSNWYGNGAVLLGCVVRLPKAVRKKIRIKRII